MKYLLVALESEVPNIELPDDYTLMITGVGKINATVMATIAAGSKEKMRKPVAKGAPSAADFKAAAKTAKPVKKK